VETMSAVDPTAEFDRTWRRLEGAVRSAVSSRQHQLRQPVEPSLDRQIAALAELGVVTRSTESELHQLHQLRRIRNVWTHEGTGPDGAPLVAPTPAAVERVLWLIDVVERVPRVEQAMVPATTCEAGDPVFAVLATMRANDFDAVPYRCGPEWFVFTRHQAAHWLELEAETTAGPSLMLDVATTVADIAALVGPSRPVEVGPRERLPVAVALLTEARAGGEVAPVLLARSKQGPLILTPSDLPRVLALLTPPE
jgi:hypothetical protein